MSEDTDTQHTGSATLVKQQTLIIALLFGLLGLQAWQTFGGTSVKAQSWEYSIEAPRDADLPDRLRTLGASGWEVVSARRATSQVLGETVAAYEMILRRPATSDGGDTASPPTPAPPR